jgi:hypothetical protein
LSEAHAAPAAERAHDGATRTPEIAVLVPAGIAVAVFVLWGHLGAGYDVTRWLPGTLFLLGLLAVTLVALRPTLASIGRLSTAALGLLAAFTAWSFLSIAWAEVRGEAWAGANRTLLYLVVFALFVSLPWTLRTGRIVAAGYALGVGVVGAAVLGRLWGDAQPELFIQGRLSYPTGYPNANAALFVTGMWAALVVAPRRDAHPALRAVLLGTSAMLAELALLSQSRGAVVAVPITVVAAIAFVPGRVRTAAAAAVPLGLVALGWHRLLDLFPVAEDPERAGGVAESVVRWIVVTAVLAGIIGLVWALVDRRVELSRRAERTIGLVAAVAAAVTLLAAGATALATVDVSQRVRTGWDEFTSTTELGAETSHFDSGLGSNRWDFWRVGMDRFRANPLAGIGADNFAADYLRDRRSVEEPLYPHSVEVRTLSQLGIVGAILLLGFLGAAAWAALLAGRHRDRQTRALAAGALIVVVYWLAHGSVDWFWEIPGISAPAFAFLGLACAVGERGADGAVAPAAASGRRPLAIAASAAGGAVALLAAVSLVLPWLSAREVDRALARWRSDTPGALSQLDSARGLDPLSDQADVYAGAIASRRGDLARMRVSFERALERNPANWYAELELGLVDAHERRWQAANRRLARALELNPGEPVLRDVRARIGRREAVPFAEIDRLFLLRSRSRIS